MKSTRSISKEERLLFRTCAVHYLHQWQNLDKPYWQQFQESEIGNSALCRFLTDYQVIRNFPRRKPELRTAFARTLNQYRRGPVDDVELPEIISQETARLSSMHKGIGPSAVSKAFWIVVREPLAIYDRHARAALQIIRKRERWLSRPHKSKTSYGNFSQTWNEYYRSENVQTYLSGIRDWLPRLNTRKSCPCGCLPKTAEMSRISKEPWFLGRVFDMRLFILGKSKGKNELRFIRKEWPHDFSVANGLQ